MPRPVIKVELPKRVRVNRDRWDAGTRALYEKIQAEEAKLDAALSAARQDNPGVPLRLTPEARERHADLCRQLREREQEQRRRLVALSAERKEAKFRLIQLGNCRETIAALERRGTDPDRLAEMRAREPELLARVEEIEQTIDAAFLASGNTEGQE